MSFERGRPSRPTSRPASRPATTKWSGEPSRYKSIDGAKLDTIITGHLTQEQLEAYQQYFRIEEISDLLRRSHRQQISVLTLLPSGNPQQNPSFQREPSPPPKYDNHGNRTNTREERTRILLEKERNYLVEAAANSIKHYTPPVDYKKPQKTAEKIYIPVKDYPDINFVGQLLGPRGNTLRQLQEESGARLAIRGKGSVKDGKSTSTNDDDDSTALTSTSFANPNLNSNADDLHVVITADSQAKIAKAIKLTNEVIEKAISSPFGQNDLKREQLRELAVLNGTLRETKPYVPPEEFKRRPGVDIASIVCQRCGKVGHYARDCRAQLDKHNDRGNGYERNDRERTERKRPGRAEDEEIPPWKRSRVEPPPVSVKPPPPVVSVKPPPPGSLPPPPVSVKPPPPVVSVKPPPPGSLPPPPGSLPPSPGSLPAPGSLPLPPTVQGSTAPNSVPPPPTTKPAPPPGSLPPPPSVQGSTAPNSVPPPPTVQGSTAPNSVPPPPTTKPAPPPGPPPPGPPTTTS